MEYPWSKLRWLLRCHLLVEIVRSASPSDCSILIAYRSTAPRVSGKPTSVVDWRRLSVIPILSTREPTVRNPAINAQILR